MKLCTSFGTRLGTQVRYSSAFYMTSAEHEVKDSRRSGIVSKLHSDVTQKEKRKVRVFVWQGIRKNIIYYYSTAFTINPQP